jgi:prevent-host-death family protein
MTTVGAFEAKTRLSELLDRVEEGEEIVITRHGKPIAVLKAAGESRDAAGDEEKVRRMRAQRRKWNASVKGIPIKELTHGGHKY